MESPPPISSPVTPVVGGEGPAAAAPEDKDGYGSSPPVDPFLVEALENPRHRLTVLRMELEIQRFVKSPCQQFEFQHFPTSYLRRAAHRVAQHYGLQTIVLDNFIDGSGRILALRTAESKFPSLLLSDIPAKQPGNEKCNQVKLVICQRPNRASQNDPDELGTKRSPVRTVEERKEEYDRARARIFNGSNADVECTSQASEDRKGPSTNGGELVEFFRQNTEEREKMVSRDRASRVAAIFRDNEKDRVDPDYDRSYGRYSRGIMPNQAFNLGLPYNALQPPFLQYQLGFLQSGQVPKTQTAPTYSPSSHVVSPYCSVGCNQTSSDAAYFQGPSSAMMYTHSYEHLRSTSFQAPFHQRPLSFENYQNR